MLGPSAPAKYKGLWPAFWALGQGIKEGAKWPKCGEWYGTGDGTGGLGSVVRVRYVGVYESV